MLQRCQDRESTLVRFFFCKMSSWTNLQLVYWNLFFSNEARESQESSAEYTEEEEPQEMSHLENVDDSCLGEDSSSEKESQHLFNNAYILLLD